MKKIMIWAMMLTSILCVSCTKSEEGDEDKLGSIYGIVTKLGTAEPMKAVGVELYKKGTSSSKDALLLKTVTFDDGHFEFKDLNPENYQVKVVADGYEQIEEGLVTVEAGRQARIDLQVKEVNIGLILTTCNVEDITSSSATFKGTYQYSEYNWYPTPSEYGFIYSKVPNSSNGTVVQSSYKKNINSDTYEFTATVNNLSSGIYYVKAYAKTSIGTAYGDVREFVITGYPSVSTLSASNISETAATLNGHIDYVGDPAYTERGFVYSYSFANPTVDDAESATTKVKVSGSSEDFSANVAGLTKNKTYYVRAYVSNSQGTWYGESVSFSTDFREYVYIDDLWIQKQDLGKGTLSTAVSMCEASKVGGYSNWRLPTRAELAILYAHKDEIGGFKSGLYWSSSSTGYPNYNYYYYDFSSGNEGSAVKTKQYYVRAVRTRY